MLIGKVDVQITNNRVWWSSGMKIDCDGSPKAYAPRGSGLDALDYLDNAGKPGRWYGIVTNTGKPDGEPIIQDLNDPAPGFYVSSTSLVDARRPLGDPLRYVDSEVVPYVSIPPELIHAGVRCGDIAVVTHGTLQSAAVVGDVGPRNAIGEGSIALAKALGMRSNAKKDLAGAYGGVDSGVDFIIFKYSKTGWPRPWPDIDTQAHLLMNSI